MKLAELQSNAYYDMQAGVPAVIQADNDGSYLFRYNIEEWKESGEDGEEAVEKYKEFLLMTEEIDALLTQTFPDA